MSSTLDQALAAVARAAGPASLQRAAICEQIDDRADHLAAVRGLEARSDAALLASVRSHLQLTGASIGTADLVAARHFLLDAGAELAELIRRVDHRQGALDADAPGYDAGPAGRDR